MMIHPLSLHSSEVNSQKKIFFLFEKEELW